MLGWTILFALMALPGAGAAVSKYPGTASLKTTGIIFTSLFLLSVLTMLARGRAR
jgi:hypothetical protein